MHIHPSGRINDDFDRLQLPVNFCRQLGAQYRMISVPQANFVDGYFVQVREIRLGFTIVLHYSCKNTNIAGGTMEFSRPPL